MHVPSWAYPLLIQVIVKPTNEHSGIENAEFGTFLLILLGRALIVSILVPLLTLTGAFLVGP